MELLKKIGDFCRQHYEKILLSFGLLGLAFAVYALYNASMNEQEKIRTYLQRMRERRGAPVKPVDLSRLQTSLALAQKPPTLVLAGEHNLVNPVKWLKRGDTLIKSIRGTEGTLDELQITRITPLGFVIAFDNVLKAGDKVAGYRFQITNEVALYATQRRYSRQTTLNATNLNEFILREVKGAVDAPSELVLELRDTGQRVSVTKEKPFSRVEAYEADLKFGASQTFNKQRVGRAIKLGSEDYNIVAISENEIVFSGTNDKKYTVNRNTGSKQ